MKYVLDANVGLKFVLPEPDSPKALRLQEEFRNGIHEILVPDFFPVEVGNALTRAERKHLILPGQAAILFDSVIDPCPEIHASMPFMPQAIERSSRLRASVFDAIYFLLAEEHDCEFVTADRRIINAFAGESRIVDLSKL